MKRKILYLSGFFSFLFLSISTFAQMGAVDEIGNMFASYIILFGVIAAVISALNLFIDKYMEKLTGTKSKTARIRLVIMWVLFALAMISNWVEVPEGVYSIVGSLIFIFVFWTLIHIGMLYAVKHSGAPERWVLRGSGRHGRREVKYEEQEEEAEEEEQETIVDIFHFLREHEGVREAIRGALESSRETDEPIDFVKELKDMYKESKKEELEDETIDKIEAAVKLLEEAEGEAMGAGEEELSNEKRKIYRAARTLGKNVKELREKMEGEKKEELDMVQEVYQVTRGLIPGAEKLAKGADKEERKHYEEHARNLKRFEKYLKKLAEELQVEIKDIEKIEKEEDKEGRKRKGRKIVNKGEKKAFGIQKQIKKRLEEAEE